MNFPTTTSLVLLGLFSLISPSLAQTQITWGSVVYAYHGEAEPRLLTQYPNLTPLGAQQAFDSGSLIRSRYLSGTSSNVTDGYVIQGIASDVVDNSQLFLLSTDEYYTAASAQAFLQGLYPAVANESDAQTELVGNVMSQYPLGGYQYAVNNPVSSLDFNFIWIAGNEECIEYTLSEFDYFSSDDYNILENDTLAFYQSLLPVVFDPVSEYAEISFNDAYPLYEYAAYIAQHNATVAAALKDSDLATLFNLAAQQQISLNANLSAFESNPGDEVRAISGKALAFKVLNLLGSNIESAGGDQKLSILTGSYEPFLAFFALSGLSSYNSNPNFQSLPLPGSIMVFELFSPITANPDTAVNYPTKDQLWVRFLFRNGTAADEKLLSYPLFGRGNSETDMPWNEFSSGMSDIAIPDIATWCTTCGLSASFCPLFVDSDNPACVDSGSSSTGSTSTDNGMSAKIAGVIGAVATLCTLILLLIIAVGCFGMRFTRRDNKAGGLGGFKGAEKLASDTDVNVVKTAGGAAPATRHERVGSWELNDNKFGGGASIVSKGSAPRDLEHGEDLGSGESIDRVVSGADYSHQRDDDAISAIDPFQDPVQVHGGL